MTQPAENDAWSCYLCGSSSPHIHGPDAYLMSSVIPPASTTQPTEENPK